MRNVSFEKQKDVPVLYKEKELPSHYRLDLIVEGRVIVELKAVERLLPVHESQVISYLK
jgi:GxxExxY protein